MVKREKKKEYILKKRGTIKGKRRDHTLCTLPLSTDRIKGGISRTSKQKVYREGEGKYITEKVDHGRRGTARIGEEKRKDRMKGKEKPQ